MTEFDEMAANVAQGQIDGVQTFNDAVALADMLLFAGETQTVRDNFAQAIYERAMRERKAGGF